MHLTGEHHWILLYLSEECYDLLLEYGIETIEQLTAIPHILREDSRFTSPIRLEIKTQFADWLSHTKGHGLLHLQ